MQNNEFRQVKAMKMSEATKDECPQDDSKPHYNLHIAFVMPDKI